MADGIDAPIVVGGTGGSGTRVVVQVLRSLGVYMDPVYDKREDSIPMGRFDRRWGRRVIVHCGESPGTRVSDRVAGALARAAFGRARRGQLRHYPGGRWGWKHPHSYLFIPFLQRMLPRMQFIHLVRNGLDMAISDNLGQLRRYGDLFMTPGERSAGDARAAALFWSRANLHARRTGTDVLGTRYVCVRFEDLCEEPLATITEMSNKLGIAASADALAQAAQFPKRPSTAGRAQNLAADVRAAMRESAREALDAFGYVSD